MLQYSVNTFTFSSIGEPAALFQKSHYDWVLTQKLGPDYLKPSDPERYERAQSRNTLRAETFAGRNYRDFRDFDLFSRKLMPSKKVEEKFAKVIFAKKNLFQK